MAQKTVVTLMDDIDGSEAAETIAFGLDGKSYEIDLNDKNAAKLRKALASYIEAGRKSKSGGNAHRGRVSTPKGSSDTAAVREWAKENGYDVNDRGRVPASIREAYEKVNG